MQGRLATQFPSLILLLCHTLRGSRMLSCIPSCTARVPTPSLRAVLALTHAVYSVQVMEGMTEEAILAHLTAA